MRLTVSAMRWASTCWRNLLVMSTRSHCKQRITCTCAYFVFTYNQLSGVKRERQQSARCQTLAWKLVSKDGEFGVIVTWLRADSESPFCRLGSACVLICKVAVVRKCHGALSSEMKRHFIDWNLQGNFKQNFFFFFLGCVCFNVAVTKINLKLTAGEHEW